MRIRHLLAGLVGLLLLAAALVWWLGVHDTAATEAAVPPAPVSAQQIERGAYLARAGNCAGCHTRRGGAPYAGGRAIDTPFGTVHAGNLTPDVQTGLGAWSAADFWRAMHHGRSRDGRLLLPVFPYTSTTRVTREDSDALFAYLRSLPAVAQPATPHALRWPVGSPWALAVWRALYFRAGVFEPQPAQSAAWNRGAYLVQGLGHCNACHAARNLLGANAGVEDLSGGQIPMQGWYAPSLRDPAQAGVAGWETAQVVQLLQTGVSPRGSALGPMAEVVLHSTQYLRPDDLAAMATYLQSLPQAAAATDTGAPAPGRVLALGEQLYGTHCADCHGAQGQGVAGAYPPLAGNRAVRMVPAANLVQVVLRGGYAPATVGNPRPFGMPPFQMLLSDEEVAAVVSYIRQAWGNQASGVSALDVTRHRATGTR
jgi:mono/diheme cytochrome c family protein